jgi:hypothetical protein
MAKKKKIGRNDPCPCGSGKKYKKCCMGKDEDLNRVMKKFAAEHRGTDPFAPKRDPEDAIFFEDALVDEDTPEDEWTAPEEEWGWGDDEEGYEADVTEEAVAAQERPVKEELPPPPAIKTISDEVPEISAAETALVDAWWDTYKKLKKPDDIRQHLETFFAEHPDLVENLELHHEVLFELGAQYVREGRHGEYINLLIRVRKEFPEAYLKSFGYYDEDLISYLVMTGRKAEIPEFLGLFKAYPSHDPNNLFKVLLYLMANNCQEIAISFVRDVYYEVCTSPGIIGGDNILEPLVHSYLIPFLRPDVSNKDMDTLAQQLREIKILLKEQYYTPDFLKKRLHFIFAEFTNWNISDCQTNKEIYTRYDEVCLNFMGFLHEQKGKDWMAAEFFRKMVYLYLVYVIPEGKRPKEAFVFTKNKIDRTLSRLCRDLIFLDSTRLCGSLNALYYFAEYLVHTNSITEEWAQQIQAWCTELFQSVFPSLVENYFPVKIFEQFPL